MKKSVKDLVVSVLLRSGRNMTISQIHKVITARRKDVRYTQIETVIRNEAAKVSAVFIRVKRGEYRLAEAKSIPVKSAKLVKKIKSVKKSIKKIKLVKKVRAVKKVVKPIEKVKVVKLIEKVKVVKPIKKVKVVKKVKPVNSINILQVEDHIEYIRALAKVIGKKYYKDFEDITSEMILLTYEFAHIYDNKYKPTTFIKNQIYPRMVNKVKRDIVPNIFKLIKVVDDDGAVKVKNERSFIDAVSFDAPINNEGATLMDRMDSTSRGYGTRHDDDYSDSEFNALVMKHFHSSGVREKDIVLITKKLGLDNSDMMTLDDIGKEEGMTKEGVRQAIKRVFNTLKKKQDLLELKRLIV